MSGCIVHTGNPAETKDWQTIEGCRSQPSPGFEYRIVAHVRRDLLRIRQETAKSCRRIRQIKSSVLIRGAHNEFPGASRDKIGMAPANHPAKRSYRHSQRKNLSFARKNRDWR